MSKVTHSGLNILRHLRSTEPSIGVSGAWRSGEVSSLHGVRKMSMKLKERQKKELLLEIKVSSRSMNWSIWSLEI